MQESGVICEINSPWPFSDDVLINLDHARSSFMEGFLRDHYQKRFDEIKAILEQGLNIDNVGHVHRLLGGEKLPRVFFDDLRLYSEFLPKSKELPFTPEQRYLHFLWDTFDRLPLSLSVPFSIPFRRLIAKQLFKGCGKNFIAEEQVRFNLGQNLEVGNDVFFNRGVFLDTKGGITIGNSVTLMERAAVFTHNHSESMHSRREYKPVVIEDYAKIHSCARILPGVTIGTQAIVCCGALVLKDVPPNTVVGGIPAEEIRERRTEGRKGPDLDHLWLHQGAFQDE
jgi:acetyltransferase-like isoleucine patch superfamily enzyme